MPRNSIRIYDRTNKSWHSGPTMMYPRVGLACDIVNVGSNTYLYVMGGYGGKNIVEKLNITSIEAVKKGEVVWTALEKRIQTNESNGNRVFGKSLVFNNIIYYLGGMGVACDPLIVSMGDCPAFYKESQAFVDEIHPNTDNILECEEMMHHKEGSAYSVIDNRIYSFGGRVSSRSNIGNTALDVIEKSNEIVFSNSPTISPTNNPTNSPSNIPTLLPTLIPSRYPSTTPTTTPSIAPSIPPTNNPSNAPTLNPLSSSSSPSSVPTISPTTTNEMLSTHLPSQYLSNTPTVFNSTNITNIPSVSNTFSPSSFPTTQPNMTTTLTASPTQSTELTSNPTMFPSIEPTMYITISNDNDNKNNALSTGRNIIIVSSCLMVMICCAGIIFFILLKVNKQKIEKQQSLDFIENQVQLEY